MVLFILTIPVVFVYLLSTLTVHYIVTSITSVSLDLKWNKCLLPLKSEIAFTSVALEVVLVDSIIYG